MLVGLIEDHFFFFPLTLLPPLLPLSLPHPLSLSCPLPLPSLSHSPSSLSLPPPPPFSLSLSLIYTGVSQFVFGSGPHVIAITRDGELYSWGHNGYGQLGQGVSITVGHCSMPEKIQGALAGIKIDKVACGGHHTLALTQEGQVKSYQQVIQFAM